MWSIFHYSGERLGGTDLESSGILICRANCADEPVLLLRHHRVGRGEWKRCGTEHSKDSFFGRSIGEAGHGKSAWNGDGGGGIEWRSAAGAGKRRPAQPTSHLSGFRRRARDPR